MRLRKGDIYWDCSYHPVLCTEATRGDVAGISLLDGSEPRSCSIKHCGVTKLNVNQVIFLMSAQVRSTLLATEKVFREDGDASHYKHFHELCAQSGLWRRRNG